MCLQRLIANLFAHCAVSQQLSVCRSSEGDMKLFCMVRKEHGPCQFKVYTVRPRALLFGLLANDNLMLCVRF